MMTFIYKKGINVSNYQHILAVIDNKNNSQSLILKALTLSKYTDAKLTFLNLTNHDNLTSSINPTNSSISSIEKNKISVVKASTHKEYAEIWEELNNQSYDLIMKTKIPKHHNYMLISPSDDWKLLRNSSTPLMLVTQTQWQSGGHLLTAIETEENNLRHTELNKDILQHSYQLSKNLTSKMHLVNCYLGDEYDISINASSSGVIAENQERLHWQHLVKLLDDNNEVEPELHLQEGMPETEISLLSKKYNVNMVILGTAEHSNIMNSFFGHTSEYIIDELDCDVLAVKGQITHH
jgi:nucleotide-binding universal stress UspA family protein